MSEMRDVTPPGARSKLYTPEEIINYAIRDIKYNVVWDLIGGQYYCHICAPGGYRIKAGADPEMHENQRNPDTHQHNLRWATIQWFLTQGIPLPRWPDAYRVHHRNQMWCHICRRAVGMWDAEAGAEHDALHTAMRQRIMGPRSRVRATEPTSYAHIPSRGRRRDNHFLDATLAVQRGENVDAIVERDTREPRAPGEFMKENYYADTPNRAKTSLWKNEQTGQWENLTDTQLQDLISVEGLDGNNIRWSKACDAGHHCEEVKTYGAEGVCHNRACECTCHPYNARVEGGEGAEPDTDR